MILMFGRDIEEAYLRNEHLQLQVCFDGGYVDLWNLTTDESVTSWSADEYMEYQDQGQRLFEDVVETCLHYGVQMKVVSEELPVHKYRPTGGGQPLC